MDETVRELAIREWTWRTGEEATAHRVAVYRWLMGAWLCAVVGFVLVVVGGSMNILVLLGIGIAFFVAWLVLDLVAFNELRLMDGATGRALGMRIGFLRAPGPPRTPDHYRAWCQKYGQKPHPFKPEGPTSGT